MEASEKTTQAQVAVVYRHYSKPFWWYLLLKPVSTRATMIFLYWKVLLERQRNTTKKLTLFGITKATQ